jgi:hypothetical protein
MQRWLAVLVLGSMVSAQVSALACPAVHHSVAEPTREHDAQHRAHASAAPENAGAGLADTPTSHHGDDDQCVMMLTCTALAAIRSTIQVSTRLDERSLQVRKPPRTYSNPSFTEPTPPPRIA